MNQELRITRIERYLFYLFLFCIPFQTRIIFTEWTRPFNEWTAGFIYLTDILLTAIFVLWVARSIVRNIKTKKIKLSYDISLYHNLNTWGWVLVGFFAISAISIVNARFPGLAWFRLIKLAEFSLLFFYLKFNFGKIYSLISATAVVFISGFFQAVIAIIQYLKQGSIGLKILGESHIGTEIYNVAVFIAADSRKYLRAYGTTPHPNVLSAWLLLSLFAFYFLFFSGFKKWDFDKKYVWIGLYGILLFAFFFTFSRTAVGLWGLSFISGVWILFKQYRKKILPLIWVTIIIVAVFSFIFWPQVKARALISGDEEAVTQRIYYNEIAGKVTQKHPLFGIGIGQFVADMQKNFRYYPAYFYQPVHNIYLLISSETGVIGLLTFLLFLFYLYWWLFKNKNLNSKYRFILFTFSFAFLIFGLFDHFLWTLQQGGFVLWIALGTISAN